MTPEQKFAQIELDVIGEHRPHGWQRHPGKIINHHKLRKFLAFFKNIPVEATIWPDGQISFPEDVRMDCAPSATHWEWILTNLPYGFVCDRGDDEKANEKVTAEIIKWIRKKRVPYFTHDASYWFADAKISFLFLLKFAAGKISVKHIRGNYQFKLREYTFKIGGDQGEISNDFFAQFKKRYHK